MKTVFIALLRAVNVGGTGKLPMSELRDLCEDIGFENVTTYIQSGNVVLTSELAAEEVRLKLEGALEAKMGKPVPVRIRTPDEIEAIVDRNPFTGAAPNRVLILFLDSEPPAGALDDLQIPGGEEVVQSGQEVFVYYPDGMGRSKLKIPLAKTATARNLNTVTKLLDLSRAA